MDLTNIGYFSKAHGVKGHLILKAELDFFADEVKALFVETATGKAPYFISELKESNNGIIVLLEDVNAVEKARLLLGKKVFIDSVLVDKSEAAFDWTGFELIDKNHGSLGLVKGVSDNGSQVLLSVDYKNKEVILPLVEDFIDRVDEANKKLYFNAPDGLVDLYLEDSGIPDSQ